MMKKEEKKPKPELSPELATWAYNKLDIEIPGLNSHAERNTFATFINKLIEIAQYKEE